ncbi:unnamed protein product [Pleuronectes platessa]|uniref:Uncharacterized protein n=1 Tax=Pleuronectes platessa TaxID=8262 RepID=A0A9N7VVX3_PLEPL|nr:unnamed protein product [Pleuronectes platessa]
MMDNKSPVAAHSPEVKPKHPKKRRPPFCANDIIRNRSLRGSNREMRPQYRVRPIIEAKAKRIQLVPKRCECLCLCMVCLSGWTVKLHFRLTHTQNAHVDTARTSRQKVAQAVIQDFSRNRNKPTVTLMHPNRLNGTFLFAKKNKDELYL